MKKLFVVLLTAAMVVALAACGGTKKIEHKEPGSTLKFASHNAEIGQNPYRIRYEADLQEACAAAEAASGYKVEYNSFVANKDATAEAQMLENSINEGFDIIVTNPVAPSGLDTLIKKAQDRGIVYINADCAYTSTAVNVLNVVTDQEYLGYKTGTYAGEVLGKGSKVVMIAAAEGNQANTDRQRGFEKACEEKGLEIVETANHNWDVALSTQKMAEILNKGTAFDGLLVSQCAENALEAFENAGVAYPKFVGFGDTGAFMQKMLEINKNGVVCPYIVLSNPPGVGATALNFALNMYVGNTLRDDIYAAGQEATHQVWIQSRVCYTDKDVLAGTQVEGKSIEEYANSFEPGDSITFWLTFDEVKANYFK